MKRVATRTAQALIDITVIASALCVAFLVRFEGDVPLFVWKRLLFQLPYIVGLQYLVLASFGVPRFSWRQIGLRDVTRMFIAVSAATALLLGSRLVAGLVLQWTGYALYAVVPSGVIAIDGLLVFLGIAGVRVIRRLAGERSETARARSLFPAAVRVRTLLVGAGQAGLMVAREIQARPDLGIEAVGFVDDDALKAGTLIHGIPVLGQTKDLARLAREHDAAQILIAIAAAPGAAIRRIRALAEESGLPTKIIPGVYEIVGGRVNLSRIRPVAIEDLLGREPVTLEQEAIAAVIRDRVVMVTGAGGSIGSELCRQILRFEPRELLLVERAENALFNIHRELAAPGTSSAVVPIVADVGDSQRIRSVMAQHRPSTIFHAAAHKHVPMMEWNCGEAIKNNVLGTRRLADSAHAAGVETFVMVSTDKAVNPTSVMGTCKRIAEMYIQGLSRQSQTKFLTVRFGNVLGSAGSVVPIFQEQIASGGPVCVTHPEMQRYFMTIPEASQLILQAAALGQGDEIFVLDMGEPVKIVDLARDLIRLSGFRPDQDIEIIFTGTRPGEKLFEEIAVEEESVSKTRHPKIFIGKCRELGWDQLLARLGDLETAVDTASADDLKIRLRSLVPEYAPAASATDLVVKARTDEANETHAHQILTTVA